MQAIFIWFQIFNASLAEASTKADFPFLSGVPYLDATDAQTTDSTGLTSRVCRAAISAKRDHLAARRISFGQEGVTSSPNEIRQRRC